MFIDKSMHKNVITADKDMGFLEARAIMKEHHIRHLPVVGEDNKLIGMITDRDVRSVMPSVLRNTRDDLDEKKEELAKLSVKDVMTTDLITIPPTYTLQDALLVMQEHRFGAFPVVDEKGHLKGIISIRDLMRAFISVLGIGEPGTLLGVLVENKQGQMKKIVDAISEENVSFGSILVARHWDEGKRAVFPYILTNRVAPVKKKLKQMGIELLDPMEWYLNQAPKNE